MKTRHQLKKKALVHKLNWYHAAHGNYKKTQIFPPTPAKRKKNKSCNIGMDHITHEGGKKKKHQIAQEKQKITSKSSAAVESGATKAKSISQQRRCRSRKGAERKTKKTTTTKKKKRKDEVSSRGHN